MSDDPTTTEPTHDEFTPGPEDVEYPSTLHIASLPAEQVQAAAIERDRYDPSLELAFKLARYFESRIEDLFDPELDEAGS